MTRVIPSEKMKDYYKEVSKPPLWQIPVEEPEKGTWGNILHYLFGKYEVIEESEITEQERAPFYEHVFRYWDSMDKASDPDYQTDCEFVNQMMERAPIIGVSEPQPQIKLEEGKVLTEARYEEFKKGWCKAYDRLRPGIHRPTLDKDPRSKATQYARLQKDRLAIVLDRMNHIAAKVEEAYKRGKPLNLKEGSYQAPELDIKNLYEELGDRDILAHPRYAKGTWFEGKAAGTLHPWDECPTLSPPNPTQNTISNTLVSTPSAPLSNNTEAETANTSTEEATASKLSS